MRICYSIKEINKVSNLLLEHHKTKIFLFYGNMGVGKTTLIKALIRNLNCKDEVTSPTFSIVNEYSLDNDKIYHFDLYRINDLEEAYNIGIEDYLDSSHWVFIEWPEKIEPILEKDYYSINLDMDDSNNRVLTLKHVIQ